MDPNGVANESDNAANFANRLTHIKENHKFQKNGRKGHHEEDPYMGIAYLVKEIKEKHDIKYAYVWYAIIRYWGRVRPAISEMEHYESKISYPVSSLGLQSKEHCDCLNSIMTNGLGLVNSEKVFIFNNELHSYLASAGIDGVKVDVQNILETLGAGHGGRVKLARKYHQALQSSIMRNFPDNGIISCMSYNTDDNTVGEFMQPDWDMFHSLHPMAEYHGAARAVGGCVIYERESSVVISADRMESFDAEFLDELTASRGELNLRTRSINDDRFPHVHPREP